MISTLPVDARATHSAAAGTSWATRRVPDSHCALSVAATFLPHVVLNACLAALTARSTSSGVACANDSCFLAVDGSIVSKVALSEAADHSLALGGRANESGSTR